MTKPDFSIVITTRNRPELFERALKSVLEQEGVVFEIVVVNDGSDDEHLATYKALEARYQGNITYRYLSRSMRGHGPCYAANHGVLHACGQYVGFLDDDDCWIDPAHLRRALRAFRSVSDCEVYYALQEADLDGKKLEKPVWIERNKQSLVQTATDVPEVYIAAPVDLVEHGVFAHVNTTLIERAFFLQLGGFDEDIRYEGDREFFLRTVDRAKAIAFTDCVIARHYVPNPSKSDNMSTAVKEQEKLHYQLQLYSRLLLKAKMKEVKQQARLGYGYTLKNLATLLAQQHNFPLARYFAGTALMAQFSLKWGGYYLYLVFKSLFFSSKG